LIHFYKSIIMNEGTDENADENTPAIKE